MLFGQYDFEDGVRGNFNDHGNVARRVDCVNLRLGDGFHVCLQSAVLILSHSVCDVLSLPSSIETVSLCQ